MLPVDPSSVLTGGLDTTAQSRAQGGYLDFIYNGSFNVGSGDLRSDATSTPRGGSTNSYSDILTSILPLVLAGGALWIVSQTVK